MRPLTRILDRAVIETAVRERPLVHAGAAMMIGVVHAMSFAPRVFWWLELLALAGLVLLTAAAPHARRAALVGFAFGCGWLGAGVYWLYISLHVYGELAAPLAALSVAVFCAAIAVLPALATWVSWRLTARLPVAAHAAAFACAWSASEWLRATLFTGFPWIATGYAHVDGPLGGYAAIVGVHGITLAAAFIAATLATMARTRGAIAVLAVSLVLLALGQTLRNVSWTVAHNGPIHVRLLQGNVPQDTKFLPENLAAQYRLYWDLIAAQPADLIVLPETALPVPIQDSPADYFDTVAAFAHDTHSTVLTGVFILERDPRTDEPMYTNGAVAITPTAKTPIEDHKNLPSYRKHHLVAFGEFIPWGFRWFVDALNIPIGDQESGALDQPPIVIPAHDGTPVRIGPNICYEDYFGDEIATRLRRDDAPDILVNMTNIAWFGDTTAQPQHLLASRMRSMETGRPMLRATNTGITALVGPNGRVQATLAPFTRGALAVEVQGMQGRTPYMRWIDWPFLVLCFGGLLFAAIAVRRSSR